MNWFIILIALISGGILGATLVLVLLSKAKPDPDTMERQSWKPSKITEDEEKFRDQNFAKGVYKRAAEGSTDIFEIKSST